MCEERQGDVEGEDGAGLGEERQGDLGGQEGPGWCEGGQVISRGMSVWGLVGRAREFRRVKIERGCAGRGRVYRGGDLKSEVVK